MIMRALAEIALTAAAWLLVATFPSPARADVKAWVSNETRTAHILLYEEQGKCPAGQMLLESRNAAWATVYAGCWFTHGHNVVMLWADGDVTSGPAMMFTVGAPPNRPQS